MIRKQVPLVLVLGCLALFGLVFVPGLASSEDAKPDAKKPAAEVLPPLSTDEEVEEALADFKVAFKAKGLRGDDRTAQRDYAMEQLTAFQHKKVVDAIAKKMRHADENVRLAAVVHLGSQRALPYYAGKKIAEMAKKYRKDVFFQISAFDSIAKLKYLGAGEQIEAGIKHQDFGVKKAAIAAVGEIADFRLLQAMLKEVGIDAERIATAPEGGGQPEQVGEGYTWEGAEAEVDTGTAGDGDQKAAEKQAKEKAAANKAAAEQKAKAQSGGGLSGSPSGGSNRGRGGGGRSKQELIYPIKAALAKLTGEDFKDGKDIFIWIRENRDFLKTQMKDLTKAEKAQKDADKKK